MSGQPPVTPVDAATVILVRQATPWQCFMVRRHIRSDFAADVFVFPGGQVDSADSDPALSAHIRWPDMPGAVEAPLWVTAIRELFEEAGVLLARTGDGHAVRFEGSAGRRFAEYRRLLHAGQLSLTDMAAREGITYAADLLTPFSRWITPEAFPRRFDTWFFVARMPAGQTPLHDAVETTDGVWIAAEEALQRYKQGTFPLVFATEKHLERLSRCESIDHLLRSIAPTDLQPVMPRMVRDGGKERFLLPDDEGY